MTYSNLGPWEDDGLPTDEERENFWRLENIRSRLAHEWRRDFEETEDREVDP